MSFGKLTRMEHSFFTIADLSDMLRVSPGAVRNLINHGEIKAIQIGGRGLWRIEASAFEEYLKRQYGPVLSDEDRQHKAKPGKE